MKRLLSVLLVFLPLCMMAQNTPTQNTITKEPLQTLPVVTQPDAFMTDMEAIYGNPLVVNDTNIYMYQYVSAEIRGASDASSKLDALHDKVVELYDKYGGPSGVQDLIAKRPQPWNTSCNIVCAGLQIGCNAGCSWRNRVCTFLCAEDWKNCAKFCNIHFPHWPDAPAPKPTPVAKGKTKFKIWLFQR